MPVKQEFTYEPSPQKIEQPEDIIRLLEDVRDSIIHIDSDFDGRDLKKVLQIIEDERKYRVNGNKVIEIDLSEAYYLVNSFRTDSEGGCKSCVNFRRVILNEDRDSFLYCGVHESFEKTPDECGYGMGSSPMISKHYNDPCGDHQAKFPKTLSQLL